MQVGPALEFTSSAAAFSTPVAVALEPSVDPTDDDPLGLYDATTWLSRLDDTGGFLFLSGPTPNDGEHVVPAQDLARFGPHTGLHLFLQRVRVTPIAAPGFAAGSRVAATSSASVSVRLR